MTTQRTRADIPEFGEREPGAEYADRPSAYVLVFDAEGRVATTMAPQGHFLPGGGVDPGETPAQAAVREAREECGFLLSDLEVVCEAVQYVKSLKYGRYFRKYCTFFRARLIGLVAAEEADHELVWLTPVEAMERLTAESQRFAVRVQSTAPM